MKLEVADLLIPFIIAGVAVYGIIKKCRVFEAFTEGAAEGLRVVVKIAPSMLGIMLALGMFKASGALDILSDLLAPIIGTVGIPKEVAPLMLMRPISGSGSLAIFKGIIESEGPDSLAGKIASVMQGSTETTFYTIALYYGVTKVKNTRHTLAAAAAGDLTGYIMSALTVALLMS